jgi:hypothetical protein
MRVVFLTVLFLVINRVAFAQDLKHVTKKNNGLIESYYVYKTDKKTKEGVYNLLYNKDTLIKGNYKAGKAVGLWEIEADKKEPELLFDYDSGIVRYYKFPEDENINFYNINRPPICMIGFNNLELMILTKSNYPKDFVLTGPITANVTVAFTIDSDGVPANFHIIKSSNMFDFDNQAYNDIKKEVENEKWIPALDKNNSPVSYDLKISITYTLK